MSRVKQPARPVAETPPGEYPIGHPKHPANPYVLRGIEREAMAQELAGKYPQWQTPQLFAASFYLKDNWRDLGKWLEYLVSWDLPLADLPAEVARGEAGDVNTL